MTSEEIPDITCVAQYEAYATIEAELTRGLPQRSSPEFNQVYLEWTRSREGVLARAYAAKMADWEEQLTDDCLENSLYN
jgi:hypothetical protein